MAKSLVTGGSGFIATHIVDALKEAGHDVVVLDKIRPHRSDVGFVDCDMLDVVGLIEATKGVDYIYHTGAVSNVNYAFKYPSYTVDLNIKATTNVLDAARINGAKRVFFSSTVWVYHASRENEPVDEEAPLYIQDTRHIYTSSKIASEMLFSNYATLYNVPFTIFRYGIPYGPRMREELLIPLFLKKAYNGQALTLSGEGDQFRNFVYVTDLAKAHVMALSDKAINKTYNLDGPEKVTVRRVAENIQNIVGRDKVKIEFTPARPGDFAGKTASNARILKDLGWQATTTFEKGLAATVDFFQTKWNVA